MPTGQIRTSHRPGTATKSKGQERLASILGAARAVFMGAGYAGFTMRKVAEQAGITIGNLSYYYRSKEDLLRDMIDHVIEEYVDVFGRLRDAAGQSPSKQLESMLDYWIEDLGNPDTTAFFPELWAMGNHDGHVAAMVDRLYARVREPMDELIQLINPACSKAEARELSLFMCAAMEGLTVFAGNGKPWAGRRAQLKRTAIASFLRLIAEHGRDRPAAVPGPVA